MFACQELNIVPKMIFQEEDELFRQLCNRLGVSIITFNKDIKTLEFYAFIL